MDAFREIQAVQQGDQEAWKRWKEYDSNYIKAQAMQKQPWVLSVNQWGWSPYMCMLNQLLNPPFPGMYMFPSPELLSQLIK